MIVWLNTPSRRFTTFSPFVRFPPGRAHCPNTCLLYCRSVLVLAFPRNIQKSQRQSTKMKGCLKLSPTPSLGHDSQGPHHNVHEVHCYYAPTITSSPTSFSSPATASSSSSTDAANTTPTQIHTQTNHRKCVAFCAEGSETVYPADEWDRSPAEPARKLSYQ
jgi:hypothetical protein